MVGASCAVEGGCFKSSLAMVTRRGKMEPTSEGRMSFFCRNLSPNEAVRTRPNDGCQSHLKARTLSRAAKQPAYICGASELARRCLISSASEFHLLFGRSKAITFLRV